MIPQHRLLIESAGPVLRSISHDLYSTKVMGLAQTRWNATHAGFYPNFLDEFLIQQMHQCRMMKVKHQDTGLTLEKLERAMMSVNCGHESSNPLTLLVSGRQWCDLTKQSPEFEKALMVADGPNRARLWGDVLVRQCSGLPCSAGIRSCFLYRRETFHYELSVHSELEDNVLTVANQFSWSDSLGAIRIQCKED